MPTTGRETTYFTNGNVTKYVYSATGEKLRVIHYTAVPNITRTVGVQPPELTQAQILHTDYTSYFLGGRVIMMGSKWDKILFDGGYCQATPVGSSDYTFAFYYYNRDHLGNIREVADATGTVQQVNNYYPFGTPYCDDAGATSPDFQPYKYNGKELDRMHGLDTYDYGARQYDPVLCRWDRMDPLSEKYYGVSPYAYCGNNPVNMIDADGREIWIYYIDDEGHEQSIQYFVGMSCCVDNPIAQIMVDNLNTMYTNESGKKVIDALISSKVNYGYKQADVHSDGGEGFFDPITNTISMDDVKNTLNFAEETFHMYQNENNQGGITDVNEVEAKLFSAKMNYEIQAWFDSTHGTFGRKLAGNVDSPYTYSMDKLFYDGYSDLEYKTAINNFFSGSLGGSDYKNKLKYKHGIIKKNPLIKSFLPAKFQ